MKYGGSVATSGFTGGREVSTTVLPHILRGVNWIGIDSVQCQKNKRLKVCDRLSDDLKPTTLNNDVANEISLKELPGVLWDILDGKIRGRTIVKL